MSADHLRFTSIGHLLHQRLYEVAASPVVVSLRLFRCVYPACAILLDIRAAIEPLPKGVFRSYSVPLTRIPQHALDLVMTYPYDFPHIFAAYSLSSSLMRSFRFGVSTFLKYKHIHHRSHRQIWHNGESPRRKVLEERPRSTLWVITEKQCDANPDYSLQFARNGGKYTLCTNDTQFWFSLISLDWQ